ncbi:aldo/keto reductase [Lacticaseibacillus porcinae]|uniref:aldo/keto reductase n=1 Tax=Lacticaseibacillus porcinae TaxID=1123687 RepID=UPI000F79FDDF|nr:aldo/keto reductase [Lacticaseibacillus porcinae]
MYEANSQRYDHMQYRPVGNSGLHLPAISLGLWHNFGSVDPLSNQKALLEYAFDHGITHFDLANNYGPVPGSAESNFGRLFHEEFAAYRDEMIISTKAGYLMWPGPYGEWGSRKHLIASLDQSLRRLRLDYVDIFYHHRPDLDTPLEETAETLAQIVRSGKALYIGISNYQPDAMMKMSALLHDLHVPFIIQQQRYNMFNRDPEHGLFQALEDQHLGAITFSPLAQGLLSDRYLHGIPEDSRAARPSSPFLQVDKVEATLATVKKLNIIAQNRGQSLAAMALAWNLRQPVVASVLVGASRTSQLAANLKALEHLAFTADELAQIDAALQ